MEMCLFLFGAVEGILIEGAIGGATLALLGACVIGMLRRTWFDPAWMAARNERLLNDPLYEENWETWA